MIRLLPRAALTLILLPTAIYLADYAIWRLRHSPTSTVTVTRIVVAPLKGNREEYYPAGTADLPCTRSLFPQSGTPTCWQLARTPTVYDR